MKLTICDEIHFDIYLPSLQCIIILDIWKLGERIDQFHLLLRQTHNAKCNRLTSN